MDVRRLAVEPRSARVGTGPLGDEPTRTRLGGLALGTRQWPVGVLRRSLDGQPGWLSARGLLPNATAGTELRSSAQRLRAGSRVGRRPLGVARRASHLDARPL